MSLAQRISRAVWEGEAMATPGALIYNTTVARVLRKPEAKIAAAVARKLKDGTVLDIGSGPGYLLVDIARVRPALTLLGIDLSRLMVRMSRRHAAGIPGIHSLYGNAARLPFRDRSIDLVLSTASMHHWTTPEQVFTECYRVLKNGGEAWIYDGCPDVFDEKAHRERLRREHGLLIPLVGRRVARRHGFTRHEYEHGIAGILHRTGFEHNYRMEPTDIWMKITLKKPA